MTKSDFIRKVQDQFVEEEGVTEVVRRKARYTQAEIKEVLGAIENVVYDGVANLDEVPIINGVTIVGVKKEAHMSKNPRTGEAVLVAEKIAPKAKIGLQIKRAVNNR